MSSKPTSTAKHSNSSAFSRSRGKVKAASRHLTSEIIADDIAAFKKSGGHIEVMGNSPYRSHAAATAATAASSNAASKRKTATTDQAAKKTARG